jgi:hypothetical protein
LRMQCGAHGVCALQSSSFSQYLVILLALYQFILLTYTQIIGFTGHCNVLQAILHALVQWAWSKIRLVL